MMCKKEKKAEVAMILEIDHPQTGWSSLGRTSDFVLKMIELQEFPGSLVVGILGFHCCGLGPISGLRTEILQAVWPHTHTHTHTHTQRFCCKSLI